MYSVRSVHVFTETFVCKFEQTTEKIKRSENEPGEQQRIIGNCCILPREEAVNNAQRKKTNTNLKQWMLREFWSFFLLASRAALFEQLSKQNAKTKAKENV